MSESSKLGFWNYFWFIVGLFCLLGGVVGLFSHKIEWIAVVINFAIAFPAIDFCGVIPVLSFSDGTRKAAHDVAFRCFGFLMAVGIVLQIGRWVYSLSFASQASLVGFCGLAWFGIKKYPSVVLDIARTALIAIGAIILLIVVAKVLSPGHSSGYDADQDYFYDLRQRR